MDRQLFKLHYSKSTSRVLRYYLKKYDFFRLSYILRYTYD
jgi:hypothetical protein